MDTQFRLPSLALFSPLLIIEGEEREGGRENSSHEKKRAKNRQLTYQFSHLARTFTLPETRPSQHCLVYRLPSNRRKSRPWPRYDA